MCIGAHVDDIEIGCGGTLLRMLDSDPELEVTWWIATGNSQRQEEARASAKAFLGNSGTERLHLCEFQDGYLPHRSAAVKDAFFDLRSVCQPELIFTHRLEDRHQDHRLLAELTWNTFRDHWILEYEIPKYEGDLGQPNLFVPLSEEFATKKIDLMFDSFVSQREKDWFQRDNFEALMRLRGIESKSTFAEAFTSRKLIL
ncbi:MAG: PIG-L deacetylase family protein [Planctomycetota bacterium]